MTSCSTNEFSLAIFPIVNSEFLYKKVRFAPESCQSLNSVESTALAELESFIPFSLNFRFWLDLVMQAHPIG